MATHASSEDFCCDTGELSQAPLAPAILGLGCWAFGGTDWGTQDDTVSIDTILAAIDAGVTHFDTAQAYGSGHSEELLGRTLHRFRDKVVISSKIMYTPPQRLERSIRKSLRRLRTEYIDILYIHWPKRGSNLMAMMEGLLRAQQLGLIRSIGVSNFSGEQLRSVLRVGPIGAVQLCYNLLWRWDEQGMIPFCRERGIPVVAYSAIAQGILTGKFREQLEFLPSDHRGRTTLFSPEVWPAVHTGVAKFSAVAQRAGVPLHHLAINWVRSQPGIHVALVGARDTNQLQSNLQSLIAAIDPEILEHCTALSNSVCKQIPNTGNIFRWYP